MGSPSDIVVTGMGLVSPLGASVEATWRGVVEGRSAFGWMPDLEQRGPEGAPLGGAQAAEIPADFEPGMARVSRYLRFAIAEALGEMEAPGGAERTAIVLGTTLHGMRAGGEFLRTGDAKKLSRFLAGPVLEEAVRGMAMGPIRITLCSACSSGLGAIALGATLLRAGLADRVIAGGYDPVSEYSYAGFDSLRLVAPGPARPFGADRAGMNVSEGYGALVLERAGDVLERGGAALCAIAGMGESADAHHLTQPHPAGEGASAAVREALRAGGLTPENVDLIVAHATATPGNDAGEYAALAATFGERLRAIPVVAFKSHLGHTLGAAGAVELILAIEARRRSVVPPTANTEEIDPAFVGLNLARERLERPVRRSINLSLGFGGANTCVAIGPVRGRDAWTGSADLSSSSALDPVITGVGVVLPGAVGLEALAKLVERGLSPSTDTGPIPEGQYSHLATARRSRRMSDYSKLTLASASAACAQAGLEAGSALLARAGAILGTTHGSSPFCEQYYGQIVNEGMAAANPVLFAEGVPNAAAAHLSMGLGLRAGCQTIIGTRCAGVNALALAATRIRLGEAERLIVAAAEEHSAAVTQAYAACGLCGGPEGFVTGAGSVAVVLETRAAAVARRARVLAEIGEASWHGGRRHAAEKAPPGLPELFSVNPLAVLASRIATGGDETFFIESEEFSGGRCAVQIMTGASARRL